MVRTSSLRKQKRSFSNYSGNNPWHTILIGAILYTFLFLLLAVIFSVITGCAHVLTDEEKEGINRQYAVPDSPAVVRCYQGHIVDIVWYKPHNIPYRLMGAIRQRAKDLCRRIHYGDDYKFRRRKRKMLTPTTPNVPKESNNGWWE